MTRMMVEFVNDIFLDIKDNYRALQEKDSNNDLLECAVLPDNLSEQISLTDKYYGRFARGRETINGYLVYRDALKTVA